MIFRSAAKKNDPLAGWHRSDRAFFASGACHILADAFLRRFPDSGFHAMLIQPRDDGRGTHVFVTDGATAFDYHGFSAHDRLVHFYSRHLQRRFPGWQADLVPINGSLSAPGFCHRYNHREPHQFLHDPTHRADHFLGHMLKRRPSESLGIAPPPRKAH